MPRLRTLIAVAVLLAGVPGTAAATPGPNVPAVSEAARAAGFVDVRTVVPDAIIDLRYATANNFVGTQLYPANARCLVHESLAPGLATAAAALRSRSRLLVFWDCYRPHAVQVRMFEVAPNPNWVARPGPLARSHETGRSVDVTTADPYGHLADMGTDFDDFSPRATAFAEGIGARAAAERAALREAMKAGGLAIYPGEWWHFNGPGADVGRPILDVPVN
ncbi:M15 family metallopeptidase [Mycolicibacter minnesotensis]